MEFWIVDSYRVAVLTGFAVIRQLLLRLKYPGSEQLRSEAIRLQFREGPIPEPNFRDRNEAFEIDVPFRDFDDIYHVLQSETPVYFQFLTRGRRDEVRIRIGTFEEDLGEGLEDDSA